MTNNQLDVTVSIVNWNTKDELFDCLKTVLDQNGSVSIEVIVVDNASSDGSAEHIEAQYGDRVQLIKNSKNLGFGMAHNQSISRSNGRYVMLLNPDCRLLEPDVLGKMAAYFDAQPNIGMMGPKIMNLDNTLQYSARHYPNMIAGIFRHTFFGKLFPKNRFVRNYLMTDWAHDQVTDIDWLSGAALMVRRETFKQIGLLDERFFMYCEDVDWCRRAHTGGWRVVYFPMTSISHRIGAASDKNPIPMIKQHHRSMLRYFFKYDAKSPRILLTPFVMLALWFRSRSLIKRARSNK
ncbi:MAG: glycosyltransferase family 2 protein [Armatimonadetes bacterium]|nr:glycosyltransferase family 2 protein [Armatimonadota bacterium]